jgi:hypothetical protein
MRDSEKEYIIEWYTKIMMSWYFVIHLLMIVGVTRMKDPDGLQKYYNVDLQAPM